MCWRMHALCIYPLPCLSFRHVLPVFLPHFSRSPPFLPSTLPPSLSGSLSLYIHVTVSVSIMSHILSAESEFSAKSETFYVFVCIRLSL